ncbi:hypothetical protein ACFSHT_21960 [Paraburkholderia silviterrae]|uniref:hypothetical protein n=1 Tax=Paraburkholderia silviterrae TaxID=2528715 RepID=UPI001F0DA1A3|nr:hypothetical protein [Paraburkholderia silviterrae]
MGIVMAGGVIVAACVVIVTVVIVPVIMVVAVVTVPMIVGMFMVVPLAVRVIRPVIVGTGARMTVRVVLACVRMRAAARVIVLRFIERDCRFRRARRRSVPPFVARPKALRVHKPRPESLDHGRFLPKVTESLNSL